MPLILPQSCLAGEFTRSGEIGIVFTVQHRLGTNNLCLLGLDMIPGLSDYSPVLYHTYYPTSHPAWLLCFF